MKDWVYAFVWLNEALSHVPLSSKGNVSAMMDGVPNTYVCGQVYQLQIHQLLQYKDMVACPEGLNGKLEALHFTFQELPLLDAAAPSKPIHEPQPIEVDLSGMQSESMTTAIQVPTTILVLPPSLANSVEPPSDITMAINLQLQGALEWLQWASPTASSPVSQHSMLRREPPSAVLGVPPSTKETEDPLGPEGMDSTIPALMATLMQTSPWAATLGGTPASLTLPTAPANHAKGTGGGEHVYFPPGLYKLDCQISYFYYRRKWTWP